MAEELKAADGNYKHAFNRYNELLRTFVETNQQFGVSVRKSFLVSDELSKEDVKERSNEILQKTQIISNAITLPEYNCVLG